MCGECRLASLKNNGPVTAAYLDLFVPTRANLRIIGRR